MFRFFRAVPKDGGPTPVHWMDLMLDELRLAKAHRAMFEKQAEQAYGRYTDLKRAEFAACERIARAKAKILGEQERLADG